MKLYNLLFFKLGLYSCFLNDFKPGYWLCLSLTLYRSLKSNFIDPGIKLCANFGFKICAKIDFIH